MVRYKAEWIVKDLNDLDNLDDYDHYNVEYASKCFDTLDSAIEAVKTGWKQSGIQWGEVNKEYGYTYTEDNHTWVEWRCEDNYPLFQL